MLDQVFNPLTEQFNLVPKTGAAGVEFVNIAVEHNLNVAIDTELELLPAYADKVLHLTSLSWVCRERSDGGITGATVEMLIDGISPETINTYVGNSFLMNNLVLPQGYSGKKAIDLTNGYKMKVKSSQSDNLYLYTCLTGFLLPK